MKKEASRLQNANTLIDEVKIRAQAEVESLREDVRRASANSKEQQVTFEKQLLAAKSDAEELRVQLTEVTNLSTRKSNMLRSEIDNAVAELDHVRKSRRRVRSIKEELTILKCGGAQRQADENANFG